MTDKSIAAILGTVIGLTLHYTVKCLIYTVPTILAALIIYSLAGHCSLWYGIWWLLSLAGWMWIIISAIEFVRNGVEFGYITLPDPPDKGSEILSDLKGAIS